MHDVCKKSQPGEQVRLAMRGDSLHPIFLTSLFYSMLHLVELLSPGLAGAAQSAHRTQPGAPCSPALTLCGAASARSAGQPARTAAWPRAGTGGFALSPTNGAAQDGQDGEGEAGVPQAGQALSPGAAAAGEGGVSPQPRLGTGPPALPPGHTEERGTFSPGG